MYFVSVAFLTSQSFNNSYSFFTLLKSLSSFVTKQSQQVAK